jgi:hypothetical protein
MECETVAYSQVFIRNGNANVMYSYQAAVYISADNLDAIDGDTILSLSKSIYHLSIDLIMWSV